MGGFSRKFKRRNLVKSRKVFMKHFKKTMENFKKQVMCSICGHQPEEGEKIDDWRINQQSNNIDLICASCYNEGRHEEVTSGEA